MHDGLLQLVPLATLLFGLVLYWRIRKGFNTRKNAQFQDKAKLAADRFNAVVEEIKKSRVIPVISADINTQKNEFVVMESESNIYEYKTGKRKSAYLGTRVKIGALPVYFGGGQSSAQKELTKVSDGKLYMTNKRLVFVGKSRSWNCKHSDVLSIQNGLSVIEVNSSKSQQPILFDVSNGFFWEGFNRLFTQVALNSPQIPDNVNFN